MNRTSYSYFSIIIFIFHLGIIKIFIRNLSLHFCIKSSLFNFLLVIPFLIPFHVPFFKRLAETVTSPNTGCITITEQRHPVYTVLLKSQLGYNFYTRSKNSLYVNFLIIIFLFNS